MDEVLSIEEAFGDLKASRLHARTRPDRDAGGGAVRILAGADSWSGIEIWGQARLDWLRRHVALRNGIPSHDTFGQVLAALDTRQSETCFIHWMSQLCPALAGQVVAIDGKTVRCSHQRGERAIHLVSAYGCGWPSCPDRYALLIKATRSPQFPNCSMRSCSRERS
jgi:hypothetical protein